LSKQKVAKENNEGEGRDNVERPRRSDRGSKTRDKGRERRKSRDGERERRSDKERSRRGSDRRRRSRRSSERKRRRSRDREKRKESRDDFGREPNPIEFDAQRTKKVLGYTYGDQEKYKKKESAQESLGKSLGIDIKAMQNQINSLKDKYQAESVAPVEKKSSVDLMRDYMQKLEKRKPDSQRTYVPLPKELEEDYDSAEEFAPKQKMKSKNIRSLNSKNKGFQLLAKMGWSKGTGMGRTEQGIVNPVKAGGKGYRKKKGVRKAGIGF